MGEIAAATVVGFLLGYGVRAITSGSLDVVFTTNFLVGMITGAVLVYQIGIAFASAGRGGYRRR